jgi:Holliday junction DNA helicase RuvB
LSRKDYPVAPEDEELQAESAAETAEVQPSTYMPERSIEEQAEEKSLRPTSFDDFIGQDQVVDNLRIAIRAALDRGGVLDHILLSGMPGLGKTSIAMLLGGEMGAGNTYVLSGPTLERGKDIVGTLTQLQRGDLLFIDEVHRMSAHTEEFLYSAMEDFRVDLIIDSGADSRSIPVDLKPFTLVGATTREGLLTAPLRSRFQIVEKLETYPPEELARILQRSAGLLGCDIELDACDVLASRSRGTPRFANRFLRRIRDVAQSRGEWKIGETIRIDSAAVMEGLERLGIDKNGLDRVDRKILRTLFDNGGDAVGLKTLAATVGEEQRTIEEVYEPHLIREGLINRTSRGRCATRKAAELYGDHTGQPSFV